MADDGDELFTLFFKAIFIIALIAVLVYFAVTKFQPLLG